MSTAFPGTVNNADSATGDYAVCRGPEPSHYGGQWIVAARGCGNTELARSIMKTLTCDPDVMKKITKDEAHNDPSGHEADRKAGGGKPDQADRTSEIYDHPPDSCRR